MKSQGKLLWSLVVLVLAAAVYAQDLKHDFSLHLELKPESVEIGSSPKGKLVLTNITNHDISVFVDKSRYAHPSGFSVQVRDSQNKAPEFTSSGAVVVSSGGSQILRPGETFEYKVDPFHLYRIIQPGVYTVQVKQFDGKTNTMVESSAVKITVTK